MLVAIVEEAKLVFGGVGVERVARTEEEEPGHQGNAHPIQEHSNEGSSEGPEEVGRCPAVEREVSHQTEVTINLETTKQSEWGYWKRRKEVEVTVGWRRKRRMMEVVVARLQRAVLFLR